MLNISERKKKKYEKLKENGICVICRSRKAIKNQVRCEICYNNMRDYHKRTRAERIKEGKCCLCGCDKSERDLKPSGEYYKTCYKCRDYRNKVAKISKKETLKGGGMNE